MIHGHWLRQYGVDGSYERIEVAPADFPAFVSGLRQNGFPAAMSRSRTRSWRLRRSTIATARQPAVGAVNTLWFEDGKLVGGNTDAIGFAANLDSPRT
jgi:shikimate dehydrogenase